MVVRGKVGTGEKKEKKPEKNKQKDARKKKNVSNFESKFCRLPPRLSSPFYRRRRLQKFLGHRLKLILYAKTHS